MADRVRGHLGVQQQKHFNEPPWFFGIVNANYPLRECTQKKTEEIKLYD